MRISDWSSDVCSSDLRTTLAAQLPEGSRYLGQVRRRLFAASRSGRPVELCGYLPVYQLPASTGSGPACRVLLPEGFDPQTRLHAGLVAELERDLAHHGVLGRSEEHTSELQSLMRISYAVFCLKKK